jgi:methionine-rich copper-binding protein CopC
MAAARRLAVSGVATLLVLALTSVPAHAAIKRTPPTPPSQVTKAPAVQPPQIYQVNPLKVNPTVQPNIMILGQYLTPATTVHVGGRPAPTVQIPDTNHVLVKLPENLAQGTYLVEVTNEAGTATASDQLVVADAGLTATNLQLLAGGGVVILLFLVMRLARTPGLA